MRISDETIAEALVASRHVYRRWTLSAIAPIWFDGARAFGPERQTAPLLKTLGQWQAFRSRSPDPSIEDRFNLICDWLAELDSPIRTRRLSDVREPDESLLDEIVRRAGSLKQNQDGPSLVAATKLLHAWNPRLFVIVDNYAMGDFVFRHKWIRDDVDRATRGIENPNKLQLTDYTALLVWAGGVMRANPSIMKVYKLFIDELLKTGSAPQDCADYDAVAFEWLVEGLVELPPAGVTIDNS